MKEGVHINIGVLGTGRSLPAQLKTNDDLAQMVDTSDEWIRSRTGIEQRYISKDETTSDLAAKACQEALDASGVDPAEVELIIVATMTPDNFTPSTACMVQDIIGATNAACFDLSAACSGFAYALTTAYQFLKAGTYKTALVVGAEVLSKVVDWEDRSTCILFGDGAGAVLLGQKENANILATYSGADGAGGKNLTSSTLLFGGKKEIWMDGRVVYNFATSIVNKCIEKVLDQTDLEVTDIDHFVLHQANTRIIKSVRRKLKLEEEKFYTNLHRYGNTSSATIPIALDEMVREGRIKDGDKVMLIGFGGGLTWSSVAMIW